LIFGAVNIMYRHCIFCKSDLGRNASIEYFPVGRRLAFDEARGRLWIVCPHCARWNLTPLEERWEAIEQCERRFRELRTRVSTENIGLARLPDGTDLIRMGRPLRPELAAWRYGAVLTQRSQRAALNAIATMGVTTALYWGGAALWPAAFAGVPLLLHAPALVARMLAQSRTMARISGPNGEACKVTRRHAKKARLKPDGSAFLLDIKHAGGRSTISGAAAVRMIAVLLPHINEAGANRKQIQAAVAELETVGSAADYFGRAVQRLHNHPRWRNYVINDAQPEVKLALEMAAHEEQERCALEGELAGLEAMWREAESIAAIADNLLVPRAVTDYMRNRNRSPTD
jgi:hypothetical protein